MKDLQKRLTIAGNLRHVLAIYACTFSELQDSIFFVHFEESLEKAFDELTLNQLAALSLFCQIPAAALLGEWYRDVKHIAKISNFKI